MPQSLRRPLRPDAAPRRVRRAWPARSIRAASGSSSGATAGTELGEVLCPATDRTALFLENPVQGEILRRRLGRGPGRRGAAGRAPARQGFAACREFIARRGSRWTWSTSRSSSAASGSSSITWPRSGSTSASWSRTWPARSRPGSRCGRSASATRPSCWPITATAASRSAATPTCRGCRRSRCGWPSSRKRRSTPRKSRAAVVG